MENWVHVDECPVPVIQRSLWSPSRTPNVDHHVMHGLTLCTPPQNHQPTKNEYRSTSFAAINPKFFFMINNYASYNKRDF